MKKFILSCILTFSTVAMLAVPAMRGQWRTITLADGSKVKVEAVGDEFCHYWLSESGVAYTETSENVFAKADIHILEAAVEAKRSQVAEHRMARFERFFGHQYGEVKPGLMKGVGNLKQLTGTKKGIVVMVEFQDTHFTSEHTPEYYTKVLNEGGPAEMGYTESVKQYFLDQSNDQFTVEFDVTPIIRLKYNHVIYTNSITTLIREAINALPEEIEWTQYDWDEDGEIDMVFFLYAGYGQATKTDDKTLIWPHESTVGGWNMPFVDGKEINTYACSNELFYNNGQDIDMGIGTFCHEFAHCLGYPDLYDVCGNGSEKGCGATAMDFWDLLDSGSYNGFPGYTPAPFSAYEKMTAGWITPEELEIDKEYTNLRPITDKDGGNVYIMTNPNNKNEFYIFEPIQNTSWATGFYGAQGLRVLHIDYAKTPWTYNRVNCIALKNINDHSRYTYIPADGSYEAEKTSQIKGDLYPWKNVTEFVGEWYTPDANGNKTCAIKLINIRLNKDNTVSFNTVDVNYEEEPRELPEGVVYYESFDKCYGVGGNDGNWTSTSTEAFTPDNVWTAATGKGAYKCAIFGSNTQAGTATTENIELKPGDYTLKFKVASFGADISSISIKDPLNTATTFFDYTTFNVERGKWNDCETYMRVEGDKASVRFTGAARKRWFLDEVMICEGGSPVGIQNVNFTNNDKQTSLFNLQGQKVDNSYRGIVIRNGKKILK